MRASVLLVFLFILFSVSQGQNNLKNYWIGHYMDINMEIIDGYYNMNYQPEKSIRKIYTLGLNFTPGHYIDRDGNVVKGEIKFTHANANFKFKSDLGDPVRTIYPDECNGFVIGKDSFAVIQNFTSEGEVFGMQMNDREFAEVIDEVGDLVFFKHAKENVRKTVVTYLVKKKGTKNYVSFPKPMVYFKKKGADTFAEFAALKKKIEEGKYTQNDIPSLISLLKYYNSYTKKEKVYFNSSWDEIESSGDYTYTAKINAILGDTLQISYYLGDSIKLIQGNFTSLYPQIKNGELIYYYPNGSKRQMEFYDKNRIKSRTDFHINGTVNREITYPNIRTYYNKIYDSKGTSLLDEFGNGIENVFDSVNNRVIFYEYKTHQLYAAYFINSEGKKIYQLCDKNAKIKYFSDVETNFRKKVKYPKESLKNFSQGIALVKCIIDPEGLVSDIQIVKSIDQQCDSSLLDFLQIYKTEKIWIPGKHEKEKVPQEILLPVYFSIENFSRNSTKSNFWMYSLPFYSSPGFTPSFPVMNY